MIAEIVQNPYPRERAQIGGSHHHDYDAIRNHLTDVLMVRPKAFRDAAPASRRPQT